VHEEIPTSDGLPAIVDTVQSALGVIKWICIVLAVAGGALLVVAFVRRAQLKHESDQAVDHLELGTYRDYSQPAEETEEEAKPASKTDEPVTRPIGEDAEDAEEEAEEDTEESEQPVAEEGDIMAETLARLYPNRKQAADADLTIDEDQEEAAEGDVAEEEAPAEEAAPEEEPAPADEPTSADNYARRRRRRTEE
jgi:FtsZ-interacting cell division protein ZipA